MRLAIAWICYWLGDLISVTLMRFGYGYRAYNRLMLLSVDFDDNEVIWK
jgi:hypothetical protein